MKKIACYLSIVFLLIATACAKKEDESITVSAAASLNDALQEIAAQFHEEYPNIKIQFNFGASGTLKQQIEQGAPVDIFISASTTEFQELKEKGIIQNEKTILRNELVLITSKEKRVKDFQDLTSITVEKIALGTPNIVPAGNYGMQALQHYGVWETIQEKIVYAKDVRQVLTYVETGNVTAGLVYKTDTLKSKKVRIVQTVKKDSHDEILYPAGVVKDTNHLDAAQIFLAYLTEENVQKIWKNYGFEMD